MSECDVEGSLDKSTSSSRNAGTDSAASAPNIANIASDAENGLSNESENTSSREENKKEREGEPKRALRRSQTLIQCPNSRKGRERGTADCERQLTILSKEKYRNEETGECVFVQGPVKDRVICSLCGVHAKTKRGYPIDEGDLDQHCRTDTHKKKVKGIKDKLQARRAKTDILSLFSQAIRSGDGRSDGPDGSAVGTIDMTRGTHHASHGSGGTPTQSEGHDRSDSLSDVGEANVLLSPLELIETGSDSVCAVAYVEGLGASAGIGTVVASDVVATSKRKRTGTCENATKRARQRKGEHAHVTSESSAQSRPHALLAATTTRKLHQNASCGRYMDLERSRGFDFAKWTPQPHFKVHMGLLCLLAEGRGISIPQLMNLDQEFYSQQHRCFPTHMVDYGDAKTVRRCAYAAADALIDVSLEQAMGRLVSIVVDETSTKWGRRSITHFLVCKADDMRPLLARTVVRHASPTTEVYVNLAREVMSRIRPLKVAGMYRAYNVRMQLSIVHHVATSITPTLQFLSAVVGDNASCLVAMARTLDLPKVSCLSHVMNLVSEYIVEGAQGVHSVKRDLRSWLCAGIFHPVGMKRIMRLLGGPKLSDLTVPATRWEYIWRMILALLQARGKNATDLLSCDGSPARAICEYLSDQLDRHQLSRMNGRDTVERLVHTLSTEAEGDGGYTLCVMYLLYGEFGITIWKIMKQSQGQMLDHDLSRTFLDWVGMIDRIAANGGLKVEDLEHHRVRCHHHFNTSDEQFERAANEVVESFPKMVYRLRHARGDCGLMDLMKAKMAIDPRSTVPQRTDWQEYVVKFASRWYHFDANPALRREFMTEWEVWRSNPIELDCESITQSLSQVLYDKVSRKAICDFWVRLAGGEAHLYTRMETPDHAGRFRILPKVAVLLLVTPVTAADVERSFSKIKRIVENPQVAPNVRDDNLERRLFTICNADRVDKFVRETEDGNSDNWKRISDHYGDLTAKAVKVAGPCAAAFGTELRIDSLLRRIACVPAKTIGVVSSSRADSGGSIDREVASTTSSTAKRGSEGTAHDTTRHADDSMGGKSSFIDHEPTTSDSDEEVERGGRGAQSSSPDNLSVVPMRVSSRGRRITVTARARQSVAQKRSQMRPASKTMKRSRARRARGKSPAPRRRTTFQEILSREERCSVTTRPEAIDESLLGARICALWNTGWAAGVVVAVRPAQENNVEVRYDDDMDSIKMQQLRLVDYVFKDHDDPIVSTWKQGNDWKWCVLSPDGESTAAEGTQTLQRRLDGPETQLGSENIVRHSAGEGSEVADNATDVTALHSQDESESPLEGSQAVGEVRNGPSLNSAASGGHAASSGRSPRSGGQSVTYNVSICDSASMVVKNTHVGTLMVDGKGHLKRAADVSSDVNHHVVDVTSSDPGAVDVSAVDADSVDVGITQRQIVECPMDGKCLIHCFVKSFRDAPPHITLLSNPTEALCKAQNNFVSWICTRLGKNGWHRFLCMQRSFIETRICTIARTPHAQTRDDRLIIAPQDAWDAALGVLGPDCDIRGVDNGRCLAVRDGMTDLAREILSKLYQNDPGISGMSPDSLGADRTTVAKSSSTSEKDSVSESGSVTHTKDASISGALFGAGVSGGSEEREVQVLRERLIRVRLMSCLWRDTVFKLASDKWWGHGIYDWIAQTRQCAVLLFTSRTCSFPLMLSHTIDNLRCITGCASCWVGVRFSGNHYDAVKLPLSSKDDNGRQDFSLRATFDELDVAFRKAVVRALTARDPLLRTKLVPMPSAGCEPGDSRR